MPPHVSPPGGAEIAAPSSATGLPAVDARSLPDAFQRVAAHFADSIALRTGKGEVELTWAEYRKRVERIATGLARAGIGRGDTVAMMLANRPECALVDTAAMHLGATPFSLYNTSSPEQIEYVLQHARSRMVVTEGRFLERILGVRPKLPALTDVVVVDEPAAGTRTLAELEFEPPADVDFDFEATWRAVSPDDIATLIYTSGTTGPPKGVELTHGNVVAALRAIHAVHPLRTGGRMMSWLPMAHVVDRVAAHYASLTCGGSVTWVADPREVSVALAEVRPTLFVAVPRIWEKFKVALEGALAQAGDAGRPAFVAAAAAKLGLDDADLVLSGAAPIAPEVLEFFAGIGVEIYEAYGMSETTGVATIAPRGKKRSGTVGTAYPGVEVELATDGEVLVRGPSIMRGYRDDPEKTAEAIDREGWMHTGDIGELDADGYLRIVDRKKEIIISAAGKNMSPANIESTLKATSPLIGSIVVIGDGRRYNTALITLDPEAVAAFAQARGIETSSIAELLAHPELKAAIADGVDKGNAKLSRVEQIKRYRVLTVIWEPGGDELTPTMKIKRKPIDEKYADIIDAMYA